MLICIVMHLSKKYASVYATTYACVWLSCILHFPLDFSCIYNAAHMHPNKSSAGGGKALSPLSTDKRGGTYKIYKCVYETDHLSYHHVERSHCRQRRRLRNALLRQHLASSSVFNIKKSDESAKMTRNGEGSDKRKDNYTPISAVKEQTSVNKETRRANNRVSSSCISSNNGTDGMRQRMLIIWGEATAIIKLQGNPCGRLQRRYII